MCDDAHSLSLYPCLNSFLPYFFIQSTSPTQNRRTFGYFVWINSNWIDYFKHDLLVFYSQVSYSCDETQFLPSYPCLNSFLPFLFIHSDYGADEVVFSLNSRHSKYTGIPEISVTKVMITLWTLGSFLHTVFDLGLWHMKACTICRYGGLVDEKLARTGRLVGLFIVLVVMGVGGYAVLLRATLEYHGEGSVSDEVAESIQNSEIYDLDIEDKRSFKFLLGYLVEFILALFVYYPIAVTVLFSGVLGCNGRVPVLGGRPREIKKERLHLQKKNESKILRTLNSGGSEKVNGNNNNDDASYGSSDSFDYFDENQII